MRRIIFFVTLVLLVLIPFGVFAQQELPPVNPVTVTGDISIAGSESLVQLTSNLSTRFSLEGYSGIIGINGNGTDAAFQELCSGTIDIALADRPISSTEVDACTANGHPPLAFRIATTGLVVTVSRQNSFATNISSEELALIYSTALSWSDVRPDWPSDPINRYGPATDSDEFQLFADIMFGGNTAPLTTAVGAQYNADNNLNLQNITASTTAIGFFDANFALTNTNLLQGVTIDGIAPTFNNVVDNLYLLTRPLLIYTTTTTFEQKPQVASFLNYYLSNVAVEASAVGLFPPPQNALNIAINRWLTANGQTVSQAPTAVPTDGTVSEVDATATAIAQAINREAVQEPVTEAPAVPTEIFEPDIQTLLVNARLDLELTATEFDGASRPPGWSGSLDIENPQLPLLIRLDLELLAAQVYGAEARPSDWFGAVSSTRVAVSRDIRHDLEIIANQIFGNNMRPNNWAGADPIYNCDRSTQALATLLGESGLYTFSANPAAPDFCDQITVELSRFVEVNLAGANFQIDGDGLSIPGDVTIETTFAVAFFNTSASVRAGVIPLGTGITPIARSYQGVSNMTLVEGDSFLVFVEWQNTSMTRAEWLLLPDVSELEITTICGAVWCEGLE